MAGRPPRPAPPSPVPPGRRRPPAERSRFTRLGEQVAVHAGQSRVEQRRGERPSGDQRRAQLLPRDAFDEPLRRNRRRRRPLGHRAKPARAGPGEPQHDEPLAAHRSPPGAPRVRNLGHGIHAAPAPGAARHSPSHPSPSPPPCAPVARARRWRLARRCPPLPRRPPRPGRGAHPRWWGGGGGAGGPDQGHRAGVRCVRDRDLLLGVGHGDAGGRWPWRPASRWSARPRRAGRPRRPAPCRASLPDPNVATTSTRSPA